jgi:hypothetical protein
MILALWLADITILAMENPLGKLTSEAAGCKIL